MPIRDITLHRKGYSHHRKAKLIGGIISWVPSHPIQMHHLQSVEQTPTLTHSSHPSHDQKHSQTGHGIDTSSPSTTSPNGFAEERISINPCNEQDDPYQALMKYCNTLDELEESSSGKKQKISPTIHKPSDSDIRFLYL